MADIAARERGEFQQVVYALRARLGCTGSQPGATTRFSGLGDEAAEEASASGWRKNGARSRTWVERDCALKRPFTRRRKQSRPRAANLPRVAQAAARPRQRPHGGARRAFAAANRRPGAGGATPPPPPPFQVSAARMRVSAKPWWAEETIPGALSIAARSKAALWGQANRPRRGNALQAPAPPTPGGIGHGHWIQCADRTAWRIDGRAVAALRDGLDVAPLARFRRAPGASRITAAPWVSSRWRGSPRWRGDLVLHEHASGRAGEQQQQA